MKVLNSVKINPEKMEAKKKLDKLVDTSTEVLYRLSSCFPFTLFPDEIIVMRHRIDIIYGVFIGSKEVMSIEIKNIFDVNLDFDLFFAAVDFKLTIGQETPGVVKFLKKQEAIKMRRIVTGLVATSRENIDLSQFSKDELLDKLREIGKARQQST